MSYLAGSTHLMLHLQSPAVATAAQQAAQEAAAAMEAAATWQVHQVRRISEGFCKLTVLHGSYIT
jgi:hypothetical protein